MPAKKDTSPYKMGTGEVLHEKLFGFLAQNLLTDEAIEGFMNKPNEYLHDRTPIEVHRSGKVKMVYLAARASIYGPEYLDNGYDFGDEWDDEEDNE